MAGVVILIALLPHLVTTISQCVFIKSLTLNGSMDLEQVVVNVSRNNLNTCMC